MLKIFCVSVPVPTINFIKLNRHIIHKGVKKHKCDQCGKAFNTNSELNNHIKNVHVGESSNKIYDNDSLKIQSHIKEEFEIAPHKCKHCYKEFYNFIELNQHINCVHEGVKKRNNIYKTHKCDQCGMAYCRQYKLMNRNISCVHEGAKRYKKIYQKHKCDQCGMTYNRQYKLKEHIRSVHAHKCEICEKHFNKLVTLEKHISSVHEVVKNHKCDKCGKFFGKKNYLNSHIYSAHKSEIYIPAENFVEDKDYIPTKGVKIHKDIKCETCDKTFSSKCNLKRHIKSVHEGVRDHKCEQCEKSFYYSHHLNTHIKAVHEGLKNHKCDTCDKVFAYKSRLRTHIETIHGGIKNTKHIISVHEEKIAAQ